MICQYLLSQGFAAVKMPRRLTDLSSYLEL